MPPTPDDAEIVGTATVGRPVRIDGLVLPGSRLEPAADPGRKGALSVRIVAVAPHGDRLRYDLEATGWEGGDHDLREVLVRADGTTTDDLPPLLIRTTTSLPAGSPRVSVPPPAPPRQLGGYGQTIVFLGVAWLVGLALLLRLRRAGPVGPHAAARPATPAEELALLVAKARAGALGDGEGAAIERLVYDAWRTRLGLERTEPGLLVAGLREDPAAAAAIGRLEEWLHAPGGTVPPADLGAFVAGLLPADAPAEGRGR